MHFGVINVNYEPDDLGRRTAPLGLIVIFASSLFLFWPVIERFATEAPSFTSQN